MKIKQVFDSVNSKHTRSLFRDLYHRKGPGRKLINPMAMLKAQLLKHLFRMRELEEVAIHACLSFTVMLAIALAAINDDKPGLIRGIKHFTT